MNLLNNPFALLIGTGATLAMILPLGRLAHDAGIDPFLWAGSISLVPGLFVALVAARPGAFWKRRQLWTYGLVAGFCASIIPTSMLLFAIPHIGSGLAGMMFALSPVVTAILSLILRVRPPNAGLIAAVACGFGGSLLIVAARNSLGAPEASQWLLLALLVPCSLAAGNVFRTAFWPEGATPLQVAATANLSIVPLFFILCLWHTGGIPLAPLAAHMLLALAQWASSIAMLMMFFRLQQIGGPTYLSQIGYVAAAVGLIIGVLVFKESYPPLVWAGAAVIAAGIAISAALSRRPE